MMNVLNWIIPFKVILTILNIKYVSFVKEYLHILGKRNVNPLVLIILILFLQKKFI
jgi:hypothetical protein